MNGGNIIRRNKESKVGEIIYNTYGTPMKVIEEIDTNRVLVEMMDTHRYRTKVFYTNFRKGNILNPYDRTICGVGYIGDGKYKGNVKNTPYQRTRYNTWADMIRRCYDESIREKHKTYQHCYVSDIWHNYNNFAEWYDENYYEVGNERMHLDKDILYKNNKFYSPETCLIVPQRINMIFMKKTRKENLPTGVQQDLGSRRFRVSYNKKYLGTYDTLDECIDYYNQEKYSHIKEVADEHQNEIPSILYHALYNWIPDSSNYIKQTLNILEAI